MTSRPLTPDELRFASDVPLFCWHGCYVQPARAILTHRGWLKVCATCAAAYDEQFNSTRRQREVRQQHKEERTRARG